MVKTKITVQTAVSGLAHDIPAGQNQSHRQRGETFLNGATNIGVLGTFPELHDKEHQQARGHHHRHGGKQSSDDSDHLPSGGQTGLITDECHNEDAWSGRRLRDRKDICELAIRQPMIVDDALGVHLRQDCIAPANREQRKRAKKQEDPQ